MDTCQMNTLVVPQELSPPTRETVGNIHYADAKDTVEKLQEKEKEVQKLKNLNRNIKNQLKEKTDNIQAVLDKLSSMAVSRLKVLLRCFCMQLVKWNFIGDNAVAVKADFYSRNIDTVYDFIKSFEQILHILKVVFETVQTEVKAIKEMEVDSAEEELE